MSAFVCSACRQVERDPFRQYTERIEYRRLDAAKVRALFTLRDLCERCVDELIAARRNPSGGEQGRLL